MKYNSKFLQELEWRGFISQITHEKELDELMGAKKITAYIGFDCTAPSLHVGSLIQIMMLRLLQKYGHKPLVLLGGGTTKIGDPSGKDEARQILSEEKIEENLRGIYGILAKFVDFEEGWIAGQARNDGHNKSIDTTGNKAIFVNNDEWLSGLNYIEFLRDVGRHFSVNRMLTFDSVKLRLERDQPLSFLEFNYMILQAYDFYVLNKKYGCTLQIGGSDQWGNIVNGVELIRRIGAQNDETWHSFGLTSPLLTTSDGKKMGKTANGAVWLDDTLLSSFEYFQYFRNTTDEDTIKFLKLFTDLSREEIAELENLQGAEINKAKEILAFEATKICHGEVAANQALAKAREIFVSKNSEAFSEVEISLNGEKKLVEIMREIGACASNGEARRLIEGRGVKIDGEVVLDVNLAIFEACEFDLQVGKKKFFRVLVGK